MNGTTPPVIYNLQTFLGIFPEFSGLNSTQCQAYFTRATGSIIGNSCTNPAFNDGNLPYLVYLATAHVAWLNSPKDANGNPAATGAPASPLVGRISTASEGSVSVATEYPLDGGSSAEEKYLAQTKYGVELWAALAPYRTAQYAARPTIVRFGRFGGFWGRGGGWGGWR
jgi:hypothetical protein